MNWEQLLYSQVKIASTTLNKLERSLITGIFFYASMKKEKEMDGILCLWRKQ
jgi:hypothetical protein